MSSILFWHPIQDLYFVVVRIQDQINFNNNQIVRDNTLAAIARKYLARTAPDAEAQSLPLFLARALRAASTASSTSSAVAAGTLPTAHPTTRSYIRFNLIKSDYKSHKFISIIFCVNTDSIGSWKIKNKKILDLSIRRSSKSRIPHIPCLPIPQIGCCESG